MIEFCKHFCDPTLSDVCRAGVDFTKYAATPIADCPCYECDNVAAPGCEFAEFATGAERAARDTLERDRFAGKRMVARAAIVSEIGPWKPRTPGCSGVMDCPICGDVLRYTQIGDFDAISAACDNETCVRWME